jgi:hypothetical protein
VVFERDTPSLFSRLTNQNAMAKGACKPFLDPEQHGNVVLEITVDKVQSRGLLQSMSVESGYP